VATEEVIKVRIQALDRAFQLHDKADAVADVIKTAKELETYFNE